MPCCARQLRSGNTQPRISSNSAMPSSSGTSGPAIPSSDIDIDSTTLVISALLRSRGTPRASSHPSVGAGPRISTSPETVLFAGHRDRRHVTLGSMLSPAEIDAFVADGYVAVRGALPAGVLRACQEDIWSE